MKFAKLSFNWTSSLQDFIQFWGDLYFDRNEKLYFDRIKKDQFTIDDIEKLFEWKNGTPLSQKKKNSLKNITKKIHIINKLKIDFSLNIFNNEFVVISSIWKIYLLHLISPNNYPMLDQHVYRAYYFLTENRREEIPTINQKKEDFYFNRYIPFFNDLALNDLPRKKIDESLWAFGKFLKTKYGNRIVPTDKSA